MKKVLWVLLIVSLVLSVSVPLIAKDDEWELIWSDEFNGSKIDTSKWNFVEKGDGFGNNELQFYTGRPENAYIENGCLMLRALQEDYNGREYTSAKLTTENKGDWTFGKFEIKAKMPVGQGIWPAIWMMPTDMKMYGGWPNCGEIDIMEYLGHKEDTVYGTIHYGLPWSHTGEPYTLPDGKKFSEEFHVFGLEWLPGEIRWLIDGKVYQTQKYWFCRAPKEAADFTYPAPFDRNFYLQLNVAVGGNWPGDPDDSTMFPQAMAVDYVKVYKYKGNLPEVEDITYVIPESSAGPRTPIGMGNYVYNGKFDQGKKRLGFWDLRVANNANASMAVGVNPGERECRITLKNPGKSPESVQLVQDRFPLEKDNEYNLKFDARALKNRTIQVALRKSISGNPTYFLQNITLNPKMKSFSYVFTMKEPTVERAELQFNVGGNADDVILDNISFVKFRKPLTVNGLTVINGPDYFEMDGVQSENCAEGGQNVGWIDAGDWMKYDIDVTQEGNYMAMFRVASQPGGWASAQLDTQTPEAIFLKADVSTGGWQNWITISANVYLSKGNHALFFAGDRVNLHWIKLTPNQIKNSTFVKNTNSWEGLAADSEGVKQTITAEKGQLKIDLSSDGNKFTSAQVFQNNLKIEKGKNYRVSFEASSSVPREIQVLVEQNGGNHAKYSDVKTIKLTAEMKPYSLEFAMASETDSSTRLVFALGKINTKVGAKHTIYLDNVCLGRIDEVTEKPVKPVEAIAADQIKNGKFDDSDNDWLFWTGSSAFNSVVNGEAKISISNVGNETWNVQYNQEDLQLVQGQTYIIKFDARATIARDIQVILEFNGAPYTKYFGPKVVSLTTKMTTYTYEFTMDSATDPKAHLVFALGKVDNKSGSPHDVFFDNISLTLKK